MNRLSDILIQGSEGSPIRLDSAEIIGIEVTITGVQFILGDKGEFAVITLQKDGDGKFYNVVNGGSQVVAALAAVRDLNKFPVRATLTRPGKSFLLS